MACHLCSPASVEERSDGEGRATHATRLALIWPARWFDKRSPKLNVPSQRWKTFVRNHAMAIVACDFCIVVTATFRILYVFVVMEHATRRIPHVNVTAHRHLRMVARPMLGGLYHEYRLEAQAA